MTSHYTVKNWERFQHYKDRNPPWIKLHYEVMTSSDWVMLADASKLLAVVCMLIASRNNGIIPNDPNYFKRVAYLDKTPNFKPLLECGFLEIPLADASTMQADARPETYSTDTEKKESKRETVSKHEDQDFEIFWKDFPKQRIGSKQKAHSTWLNALTRTTKEKIYESVKSYASSDEVARGFAKGAAAWLADDRWESDYSIVARPGNAITARNSGEGAVENNIVSSPSRWIAEGDRLAAKYRAEAERQGATNKNLG